MAEPVGIASGVLAFAAAAFQASVALCNTIKSFQHHNTRVRDLTNEVEALSAVLGTLSETLRNAVDLDLSSLDIPLERCSHACKEFQEEILKCSSRSSEGRTSFRDWAKLRYMGDDIDGFRRLLVGYKLTINVALTDATLRRTTVTAESLDSHKMLIETATIDLQDRLQGIDEKLRAIFERTSTDSTSDSMEIKFMEEEKLSTERCLQICDQLSKHIDQIQPLPERQARAPGATDAHSLSDTVINEGLQNCRDNLVVTAGKLERHMKDIVDRMVAKTRSATTSEDDATHLTQLHEEWETTRQCIDICAKANSHMKDNISVIENYATGDAVQFMVSTDGKTLHGTNRGYGWRTRQLGGHLKDETIVQVSRDMATLNIPITGNYGSGPRTHPPSGPETQTESTPPSTTWARRGPGNTLVPKPTLDDADSGSVLKDVKGSSKR